MKRIETIEELKNIQLSSLLAFHKFCDENDIKYSLAAGSLIGAIRHKGFIPWDDDIDVYLLREDYNKLISLFPKLYDGIYVFVSMERNKDWNRAYGILYDNRTIKIEDTRDQFKEMGVAIDIFPIDDVPDDYLEWTNYNKKRMLLRNIFVMKRLTISSNRSMLKNLIVLFSQLLLLPFSYKFLAEMMNKYSQKNNGKGYAHLYENCLGVYNSKNAWLKKDFDSMIDTEFEGHCVKIMSGFDDYLTTVYGNYMQLPPMDKRITHHAYKVWWK